MTSESPPICCALCSLELSTHPILDGIHAFCCTGCHTVFNILSSKNQLAGFDSHPLFLQALKSGVISNPALLEQIRRQRAELTPDEREKIHLEIGEMWCPSCAEIIRLMLLKEKGVLNCVVDYSTDLAAVEFSPRHVSKERIFEIIKQFGYQPISLESLNRKAVSNDLYLRFIVAAFCSLNIMMFAYPLYATYFSYDGEGYGLLFAWLSFATSIPVILYSGWPIWRRFFNSLLTGIFGMETLVAIGVGAAFGLSIYELLIDSTHVYFDSMSVVIAFVLLGKIIEAKAKFSAKESLMRLTRSTPKRGRKRFEDGSASFVLVKEIAKGDLLIAYQGEKIVLDGVVIEGKASCDESLMTGEAIPVAKQAGDMVLSGAVMAQGSVVYRATCSPDETALHKIIDMVERDIGHKSLYVRAADRIVCWFVPCVILVAVGAAFLYVIFPTATDSAPYETAFLRAVAILLISCPCAIGIAAPAAESYLLNALAAMGAIVRNRGCLQHLGKETVMIFDKTGTVTEGKFSVEEGISRLGSVELQALVSLTSQSMHPISCAIANALFDVPAVNVVDMQEIVGHGLQGNINGNKYFLGSKRFMQKLKIAIPPEHEAKAAAEVFTKVYFARGNEFLIVLELGDQIRPDFNGLLNQLQPMRTILLSGDALKPVEAVARHCGFNEWHATCTPLEKRELIEKLRQQGELVCMVGDGINDAPALTAAHIGISVVTASDMSIQVSDLLLTTDRLQVLVKMRTLAQKGQKIIRQNLFWAFIYNVVGIFLAAFGWLTPIFAAFAMSISSLTVLFNARRLG